MQDHHWPERRKRRIVQGMAWTLVAFCAILAGGMVLILVWPPPWVGAVVGVVAVVILLAPLGWAQHQERKFIVRKLTGGVCLNCGYDLQDNASGACPECGRPIDPPDDQPPTPLV